MAKHFLIVWLDSNASETYENYQNNIFQLWCIMKSITSFANIDKSVVIVLSVHDKPQLNSIYVLCINQLNHG